MAEARFEWDPKKNEQNQSKHGVSFAEAQLAFLDPKRVIAEDLSHGSTEKRHYCFGSVAQGVMTVRFTYRESVIRIIGAGDCGRWATWGGLFPWPPLLKSLTQIRQAARRAVSKPQAGRAPAGV